MIQEAGEERHSKGEKFTNEEFEERNARMEYGLNAVQVHRNGNNLWYDPGKDFDKEEYC